MKYSKSLKLTAGVTETVKTTLKNAPENISLTDAKGKELKNVEKNMAFVNGILHVFITSMFDVKGAKLNVSDTKSES